MQLGRLNVISLGDYLLHNGVCLIKAFEYLVIMMTWEIEL